VKNVIKCLECGKEFEVYKWRVGRAKYCSYACLNKGRKSDKSYDKPRKCEGCGKEYLPTNWYQKFCSRECFCKTIKKTGVRNVRTAVKNLCKLGWHKNIVVVSVQNRSIYQMQI